MRSYNTQDNSLPSSGIYSWNAYFPGPISHLASVCLWKVQIGLYMNTNAKSGEKVRFEKFTKWDLFIFYNSIVSVL